MTTLSLKRPFPSYPKPLFQSEANCEAIDMKMISVFYSRANKTYFHDLLPQGFTVSLVLKVRVFGTRKWGGLLKQRSILRRATECVVTRQSGGL